jgi:hypothetical protein
MVLIKTNFKKSVSLVTVGRILKKEAYSRAAPEVKCYNG